MALRILLSAAQDLEVKTFSTNLLRGTAGRAREIGFRSDAGQRFTLALAMPTERVRYYAKPAVPSFEMRKLAGGVVYVALNDFASDKAADGFLAAFAQIAKAPALIIDLRRNGNGDGGVGYRVLAALAVQRLGQTQRITRQRARFRLVRGSSKPIACAATCFRFNFQSIRHRVFTSY